MSEFYFGIDYAKLAEKLREELNRLNQVIFSKNRELGIVYKRPFSLSRKLFLYLQHLGNDTYRFNTDTYQYVMLTRPVPSDLANAVDYLEQTVTQTSETLQIDQRFILAEDHQDDLTVKELAKAVVKVGVKGDGTYKTFISKVAFIAEKVDTAGVYTTLGSKTVTLSPAISNSSTAWVTYSVLGLIKLSETLTVNERLILRVQVYGYMESGGTSQAVRLYFTRGLDESYFEVPVWED
jgi:predicted transport protein